MRPGLPYARHKGNHTLAWTWEVTQRHRKLTARYLSNIPLVLVALSLFILLTTRLSRFLSRGTHIEALSATSLISVLGDSDLAKLEADVLLSSVAANLLPESDGLQEKLSALEVIGEFVKDVPRSLRRWQRLGWWMRLLGGVGWYTVAVALAVVEGQWKGVIFPVGYAQSRLRHPRENVAHHPQAYLLLLSLVLSSPPTIPLLTVDLFPRLLLFRSALISSDRSGLLIASTAVELVWWSILISVPYGETLDRMLNGGVSHGGGTSGSYGSKLPKHIEDPTCACPTPLAICGSSLVADKLAVFSRASYFFMLPLLIRHYFTPITLAEVPAIREDDSAASSTAAFRAFAADLDKRWAERHPGQPRRRNSRLGVVAVLFARDPHSMREFHS